MMTNLTFLIISLFISAATMSQNADDVVGYWLTENSESQVQVYKQDGKYFGKIVWLKEPLNSMGQPKLDIKNPDPAKRSQKKLGLEVLSSFTYNAEDKGWTDGKIYDPKSGNTYKSYLWFKDGNLNNLQLRGYIGISLIGRTSFWIKESTLRK